MQILNNFHRKIDCSAWTQTHICIQICRPIWELFNRHWQLVPLQGLLLKKRCGNTTTYARKCFPIETHIYMNSWKHTTHFPKIPLNNTKIVLQKSQNHTSTTLIPIVGISKSTPQKLQRKQAYSQYAPAVIILALQCWSHCPEHSLSWIIQKFTSDCRPVDIFANTRTKFQT